MLTGLPARGDPIWFYRDFPGQWYDPALLVHAALNRNMNSNGQSDVPVIQCSSPSSRYSLWKQVFNTLDSLWQLFSGSWCLKVVRYINLILWSMLIDISIVSNYISVIFSLILLEKPSIRSTDQIFNRSETFQRSFGFFLAWKSLLSGWMNKTGEWM